MPPPSSSCSAEFIAITQVLVYIGAIVVLFLFGIMLTKAPIPAREASRDNWMVGGATALVRWRYITPIDSWQGSPPADLMPTDTRAVSDAIFGTYLVPFEVISLLLLAALVGAIVIARRD